ncbi:hypothetical protein AVEN_56461-1 [Araneus ventricosus]|uniref:Uncharacterized protein n=1 Tax=Araneus ventricosus TaxID=182803 RepID=A0A4Y2VCR0_ARAVE|nr:hypothetical protein AVEN_56461-1 [Araneus ventricosus]
MRLCASDTEPIRAYIFPCFIFSLPERVENGRKRRFPNFLALSGAEKEPEVVARTLLAIQDHSVKKLSNCISYIKPITRVVLKKEKTETSGDASSWQRWRTVFSTDLIDKLSGESYA